jgi:DNA mismatch endonuclease (patch repair protein)
MDTVDTKTRSRMMAAVGHKNTKPEMILRRALHHNGFRYVFNDKRLPGSPDLVFKKYHSIVFVHGCFWHRHGCKYSTIPRTRVHFWNKKFEANIKRDLKNIAELKKLGWHVKVIWECQLKGSEKQILREVKIIIKWLKNKDIHVC